MIVVIADSRFTGLLRDVGLVGDGLFVHRLLFVGPPEMLARRPEPQVHLDLF